MRCHVILIFISAFYSAFQLLSQEKFVGELNFVAKDLNTNENISITITAANGKTRWFSSPPMPGNKPYIPTTGYNNFYLQRNGSGDIGAFDAPDDYQLNPISWGYYKIRIQVP